MKKTFTRFVLLLALPTLFMASCKQKPAACISSDFIEVPVNTSINFTSCSDNADRLEWNMGDGTTFTYHTVDKAYATAGTYTVTLTVFNDNDNNSDEVTKEITITP